MCKKNYDQKPGEIDMLIDTNIIIDFLKQNLNAKEFLLENEDLEISIVSVMEIIRGLKTKKEIVAFEKFLENMDIQILLLDESSSVLAYNLFKKYYHSSNIDIADSLIAATAINGSHTLATLNLKHFRNIENLEVVKPY